MNIRIIITKIVHLQTYIGTKFSAFSVAIVSHFGLV
nr:MAG TPA: hypothetical protein [Caudoviricetes sp.]